MHSEYTGKIISPTPEKTQEIIKWLIEMEWLTERDGDLYWANDNIRYDENGHEEYEPAYREPFTREIILNGGIMNNIHRAIDAICNMNSEKEWIDNDKTTMRVATFDGIVGVSEWDRDSGTVQDLTYSEFETLFGCTPDHIIFDYDAAEEDATPCHIRNIEDRVMLWLEEIE